MDFAGKDLTIRLSNLRHYCLDIEVNLPIFQISLEISTQIVGKSDTLIEINIYAKAQRKRNGANVQVRKVNI